MRLVWVARPHPLVQSSRTPLPPLLSSPLWRAHTCVGVCVCACARANAWLCVLVRARARARVHGQVRILDNDAASAAVTRVMIEFHDTQARDSAPVCVRLCLRAHGCVRTARAHDCAHVCARLCARACVCACARACAAAQAPRRPSGCGCARACAGAFASVAARVLPLRALASAATVDAQFACVAVCLCHKEKCVSRPCVCAPVLLPLHMHASAPPTLHRLCVRDSNPILACS